MERKHTPITEIIGESYECGELVLNNDFRRDQSCTFSPYSDDYDDDPDYGELQFDSYLDALVALSKAGWHICCVITSERAALQQILMQRPVRATMTLRETE